MSPFVLWPKFGSFPICSRWTLGTETLPILLYLLFSSGKHKGLPFFFILIKTNTTPKNSLSLSTHFPFCLKDILFWKPSYQGRESRPKPYQTHIHSPPHDMPLTCLQHTQSALSFKQIPLSSPETQPIRMALEAGRDLKPLGSRVRVGEGADCQG